MRVILIVLENHVLQDPDLSSLTNLRTASLNYHMCTWNMAPLCRKDDRLPSPISSCHTQLLHSTSTRVSFRAKAPTFDPLNLTLDPISTTKPSTQHSPTLLRLDPGYPRPPQVLAVNPKAPIHRAHIYIYIYDH